MSNERSGSRNGHSGLRNRSNNRVDISPVKANNLSVQRAKIYEDPIHTAMRVDDMLKEIESLRADRDFFQNEMLVERSKNAELEQEFQILRGLIAENSKPIGYEENLMLKSQYHQERELRITAEQDVNRLRQQLADALAASHRDTLNLKKALSDM